jgi:hypothetical protein
MERIAKLPQERSCLDVVVADSSDVRVSTWRIAREYPRAAIGDAADARTIRPGTDFLL